MLETFYGTVAQICFTLLGLWWVVVQFKFDAWVDDPARRRLARHVAMYFLVPGVMSLFALLASRVTALWRIGFGVSAILGLIEALFSIAERRPGSRSATRAAVSALAAVIYLVVAIVAIAPGLADSLPGDLQPIEVEGMLVAILLFIGTSYAWSVFMERVTPAGPRAAIPSGPSGLERGDSAADPAE